MSTMLEDTRVPEFLSWLECSSLKMRGELGDVSATWELHTFAADGYFGQLDHLCAAEAQSRRPESARVAGIKNWLRLELMSDDAFDEFIKSNENDVRPWRKLYSAGAATILLAYCMARKDDT
jgi:hypothetical protein